MDTQTASTRIVLFEKYDIKIVAEEIFLDELGTCKEKKYAGGLFFLRATGEAVFELERKIDGNHVLWIRFSGAFRNLFFNSEGLTLFDTEKLFMAPAKKHIADKHNLNIKTIWFTDNFLDNKSEI